MSNLAEIQRLNEFPFREVGFCMRCKEYYTLVQLVLPEITKPMKSFHKAIAVSNTDHADNASSQQP